MRWLQRDVIDCETGHRKLAGDWNVQFERVEVIIHMIQMLIVDSQTKGRLRVAHTLGGLKIHQEIASIYENLAKSRRKAINPTKLIKKCIGWTLCQHHRAREPSEWNAGGRRNAPLATSANSNLRATAAVPKGGTGCQQPLPAEAWLNLCILSSRLSWQGAASRSALLEYSFKL